MKKFLTALIFILMFQTPSQADDIRDFQIEGMSIGDSLLDYFSKEKIKAETRDYNYTSEKIKPVYIEDSKFKNYDGIQFHINTKFKILSIEGIIWFKNDFKGCQKKQKEIDEEFKTKFSNAEREISGLKSHDADKSGKSKYSNIYYRFQTGDKTSIGCYDWTKEMKHPDNLRVGIITEELQTWINTEAYE